MDKTQEITEFDKNFNLVKDAFSKEMQDIQEIDALQNNLKLILSQNKQLVTNFKNLKDFMLRCFEFYKAGIDLNPYKGHIYWVPMGGAVGIISPKGIIATLGKLGVTANMQVVYKDDKIRIDLANNIIEHEVTLSGATEIIAGYCMLKDANNNIIAIEVLRNNEIAEIRKCAKTQNVWDKFPEEMVKKSVLKRCLKKIYLDDENFYKMLDFDNKNEFDYSKKITKNNINNAVVQIDIEEAIKGGSDE